LQTQPDPRTEGDLRLGGGVMNLVDEGQKLIRARPV
jgi:hypothetical protein